LPAREFVLDAVLFYRTRRKALADYIQIPDVPPYVQYVAEAGRTHFDFAFPIFAAEDLEVYLGDQMQTAEYRVSGVGESSGGTVAFDRAPAAGNIVTLRRRMTIARAYDLHPNRPVYGQELNEEVDRQTAQLQQVAGDVARSLRLKPIDAGADLELPAANQRANKILGFDSEGNVVATTRGDGSNVTEHHHLTGLDADDHHQYHTDGRADAWLGRKSSDDLPAGATNLYFPGFAGSGQKHTAARSDHGHAVATAGQSGFLSAAGKDKLDGIEAGATADMSDAEIVAAIDRYLGSTGWRNISGPGSQLEPPIWADEFNTLLLDTASANPRWSSYFYLWGVRHLAENNDEAIKTADEYQKDPKTRTIHQILQQEGRWGAKARYLHEVSDGTLKLRCYPLAEADKAEAWGFPYVGSMIGGDLVGAEAQTYGYWEVRARINALGKGHHFSLWLLPKDTSWPPEIDILEIASDPTTFYANSHGDVLQGENLTKYSVPASADRWHVFGFEWTPTTMRWYTDGQIVREHANYITDKQMYFLATWEVGGSWEGKPDGTTPWPGEVEIDYVRVYKEKP
jgi:hypothetical protein